MKNKNVGMLTIGIAILIGFIVFSFNRALTKIVDTTCTHGSDCPMWGTINFQTNISIGIMAAIIIIGLYLFFFGKEETIITKTVTKFKKAPNSHNQIEPKKITKENYQKIEKNRKLFGNFDPFGDFDLIFGASKLNLKIIEIPIRYKERSYGKTNISRFTHGWLLLKMVWFAAKNLKFV